MPKYKPWPAWYYGPDGQSQICQNESEVPPGWRDSPATQFETPPPAAPHATTRAEALAALKERGIPFKRNAGTAALLELLKGA